MSADSPVVIVGTGAAGLSAALMLAGHRPVTLVTKGTLGDGATAWAQGGLAAVIDPRDSLLAHASDTITAGALAMWVVLAVPAAAANCSVEMFKVLSVLLIRLILPEMCDTGNRVEHCCRAPNPLDERHTLGRTGWNLYEKVDRQLRIGLVGWDSLGSMSASVALAERTTLVKVGGQICR